MCADCSQDTFEQTYYNLSHPGDVIVLPAGTATWGNSSRANQGIIYITTNVTVVGAGDSTVITLDDTGPRFASGGVVALWAAATFKHMKIIGSPVNRVTAFNVSTYGSFNGGFRISDITYVGGSGSDAGAYFVYSDAGVLNGLIDNCRIQGNVDACELIFVRGPTNAWQSANTLGGANNIFVEDCTFSNTGYVCDANSNAHMVVRYCTISGQNKVDGHGVASNSPPRSVRNIEVYGNTWTLTGPGNWPNIELRGGTAMVFNNSSQAGWAFLTDYAYNAAPPWPNFGYAPITITAGNPTTVTTSTPHGYSTGWPIFISSPDPVANPSAPDPQNFTTYSITVTGPTTFTIPITTTRSGTGDYATGYKTAFDYPIKDQIGVGQDPKSPHSEPVYLWSNTQGGTAWVRTLKTPNPGAITFYQAQVGNGTATFAENDVIKANRDFYADSGFDSAGTGVTVGTTAQMNALPTGSLPAGYGFWVTDQGEWNSNHAGADGQLYVWNGSAWVFKYMPYTYPHPLRTPRAPSNLQIGP
jgi:hypothetical protein